MTKGEIKLQYNTWFYDRDKTFFPTPDQQFEYLYKILMEELEERDRKMMVDAFEAGRARGIDEGGGDFSELPDKQQYIDSQIKNNQQ